MDVRPLVVDAGVNRVGMPMPIQNWSDRIVLVNLQDDPQFTDDVNALMDLVEQNGGADVLLDFSGVNFLNSSNIARLLKLRKMPLKPYKVLKRILNKQRQQHHKTLNPICKKPR